MVSGAICPLLALPAFDLTPPSLTRLTRPVFWAKFFAEIISSLPGNKHVIFVFGYPPWKQAPGHPSRVTEPETRFQRWPARDPGREAEGMVDS